MFGATIPARDIKVATTSEISCILIEQCRALLEANAELQRTVIDVTWEKPNENWTATYRHNQGDKMKRKNSGFRQRNRSASD